MKRSFVFVSIFVLVIMGAGCKPSQQNNVNVGNETNTADFGIYLAKENKPVVSQDDVVSYNPETHTFKLTDDAIKRLDAYSVYGQNHAPQLQNGLFGQEISIMLNDQVLLRGVFWSSLSSQSRDSVVLLDSAMFPATKELKLAPVYPNNDKIELPKQIDLKEYFKSIGKLFDLTKITTTQPKLEVYTNDKLGFSIDIPTEVVVTDCSYETSDPHIVAPLIYTNVAQGVVLHPQWYMEASGQTMVDGEPRYVNCQKKTVVGSSLVKRPAYVGDFPYWTVLTEVVSSAQDIPKSILRQCSPLAKFIRLQPTVESEVFQVDIDVDMTKTEDSSAIFCKDLVYARYVPATQRMYYLFKSGIGTVDDPASQQIEKSLRFNTENP